MTPAILPFVHARGSWGEIGHQVGQMCALAIERHLAAWTRHVVEHTGCSPGAVEATAASFAHAIRDHAPFLWEELDGMARGAGLPVSRLLILQARAEVMRAAKPAAPLREYVGGSGCPPSPPCSSRTGGPGARLDDLTPSECTTFGVTGHRAAGGATLIGQNVDLVPFVEEFGVVIRQYPKDAPAALLYTTAGLLGHNGLNEAGVGVCANFVDDPEGWGDGLPRYLLSRLALRESSAEAACAAALVPPRAASRNLLIADDRGTIIDVEALRRRAAILRARDGLLVHANHLEAAEFQGCEQPSENSLARRARLAWLFEAARAPVTVADVQAFYRDHANPPHTLCAHPFPGRNLQTVVSVIADLTTRELHASKGSPCRAPYATYTLATCQTGALSVTVRDRFQPAVPA